MSALTNIYRYGLWIAPPAFMLGLALLIAAIVCVIVLVRKSVIVRLPLAECQQVAFEEAGPVVLCMEGPLLSRRFKGLRYSLIDRSETPVPNRPVLPVSSSGLSRGRRTLRLFHIPEPGDYTFQVDNLGPARPDDMQHEFIFTRPHFAKVVVCILAMIASAGMAIGSLVLFLLRLSETKP